MYTFKGNFLFRNIPVKFYTFLYTVYLYTTSFYKTKGSPRCTLRYGLSPTLNHRITVFRRQKSQNTTVKVTITTGQYGFEGLSSPNSSKQGGGKGSTDL